MNDDRLFGPRVDHHQCSREDPKSAENNFYSSSASTATMGPKDSEADEHGQPKRLSIELPAEMQGTVDQNGRPRKRSSWFSEMCLGKESKLGEMELSSTTPSRSSISGPDGKSTGRVGGGVGSRLRASIFSVLGKLGMSYPYVSQQQWRCLFIRRCPHTLTFTLAPYEHVTLPR